MANKQLKKLLLELDPEEESQVLIDTMEELSTEVENVSKKVDAIDIEGAVKPVREDVKNLRKEINANTFKGDKGERGEPGKEGKPPTKTELVSIIKPLIPDPIKGEKGDKGDAGKDGKDANIAELLSRVHGGGNMNRNIAIGSNPSVLSRYTDVNLKAGSNVTITYTNNDQTKYVDVTIAATGGGGSSVAGITRSVNNIATSQTAGSTAGTDYVYIASVGVALTLPTAAANTNLYTVKNTSTSSILVATTGGETIDAQANAILATQYTSIDLISDGTNWDIT